MSDDLIRRGDAVDAARQARTLRPAPGGGPGTVTRDARDVANEIAAAIRAIPAVAREPEERPSPPTCATCGGLGVLRADGSRLVPGGEGASSGRICPACAGGRRA